MSERRLRMFPPSKREWGEAYLAEFGEEAKLGRLLVHAWRMTLEEGVHTKTAVTTTSTLNVGFGLFMIALFIFTRPNPPLVAITGLCLIVQGGYTVWYGHAERPQWARRLLLLGETFAVLIGIGGLLRSTLQTALVAVDPEYGPIALAGLILAQAAATLYLYAIRGNGAPVAD